MTRLVKLNGKQPLPIETTNKKVWICTCGLSDKFPYCSGKHKFIQDEDDNVLYMYDENLKRKEVKEILFYEE